MMVWDLDETLPARERLDLVKRMCAQNPDFTKNDKVQELYESHYSRDLTFIEQKVAFVLIILK